MESAQFIKWDQDSHKNEEPLIFVKTEPMDFELAIDPLDTSLRGESTNLAEYKECLSKVDELVPTIKLKIPDQLFDRSQDIDSKFNIKAEYGHYVNDAKLDLLLPVVKCERLNIDQTQEVQIEPRQDEKIEEKREVQVVQIEQRQEVQEVQIEQRQGVQLEQRREVQIQLRREIQEKIPECRCGQGNAEYSLWKQKEGKAKRMKKKPKPLGSIVNSQKSTNDCLLEKHNFYCNSGKRFKQCAICSYKTCRLYQLKQHTALHFAYKPFKCSACSYKCNRECDLMSHMATHSDVKPYNCTICPESYTRSWSLKRHIMVKHKGDKPCKCPVCPYSSVCLKDLKRHLTKHDSNLPNTDEIKHYNCYLCSFSSVTSYELKRHMFVHTGHKPIKCSYCRYRCVRADQLKTHLAKVHARELQPNSHMLTHSTDEPFVCDYCGYSTYEKNQLANHIMRKHLGIKPYRCSHCTFRAVDKWHLKRHLVRHSHI